MTREINDKTADTRAINELERRILGACLQRRPEAANQILATIKADFFVDPARKSIFNIILDIIIDGETPTRHSIIERAKVLKQEFVIEEVTKLTVADYGSSGAMKADCTELRDMGLRYQLVSIGNTISRKAGLKNGQTTAELTHELYNGMLALLLQDQSGGIMTLDSAVERTEKTQDEYRAADFYGRLKTGFLNLDATFNLLPGKMTVVGGSTSNGKSAFVLAIANNMIRAGIPVLYVSIEMDYADIVYRMAAMNGETGLGTYLSGAVHNLQAAPAILEIAPFMANLHICDMDSATESEIVLIMQQHMIRYPETGLIIIDYLQNVDCDRHPKLSRHLQVSSIAKYFRSAAKRIKAPVFLVSQLARPEKRDGKFRLANNWNLKESGDIENTADAIILINRLGDEKQEDWFAVVHVSKQRMGRRGMISFYFTGKNVLFEEQPLPPGIKEQIYGAE